jgi:signal transduction histidine kinase
MFQQLLRRPRPDIAALLTLFAATAGVTIFFLRDPAPRLIAVALLGAMALLLLRSQVWEGSPQRYGRYVAAQAALALALAALQPGLFVFIFPALIITLQAGLYLRRRAALLTAAVFMGAVMLSAALTGGWAGAVNAVLNLLGFPLVLVFAQVMREAEEARLRNQRLLEELRAAQRRLQELAVAEERGRLARDLHDSAKQQAFALSAQLDAARLLLHDDPAAAELHLRQAEELADGLREELAAIIFELHPPTLGQAGLADGLRRYLAVWSRQQGVAAALSADGAGELSLELQQALFRIAQEALANVARHSGARHVELRLERRGGRVRLLICDDGGGFAPEAAAPGLGLRSMGERAEALPGGSLRVVSAPGQGASVEIECEE